MKKIVLVVCILSFSVPGIALASLTSTPVEVWTELGPEQVRSNQALYYGGGVYGGTFYTGQLNYGPLAYSSVQTAGTANTGGYYIVDESAGCKASVPIGDYIFWSSNRGGSSSTFGISRVNSDWTNNVGKEDPDGIYPEAITTDGTYLFTNDDESQNTIHKYSITNAADSFTLTSEFATTVTGAGRFRAISYYDGSIYAVDYGVGKGLYAIDAATGGYTALGVHSGSGAYQAVRYNDQLLVVGLDGNLTVYDFLTDTTLGAGTAYDLGQGALYGLGVVGDGTDVTGFWVTSASATSGGVGEISYFSVESAAIPEPGTAFIWLSLGLLACSWWRRK